MTKNGKDISSNSNIASLGGNADDDILMNMLEITDGISITILNL